MPFSTYFDPLEEGPDKKMLAIILGSRYNRNAVLCGELAVPCNLQSATARQNAYLGFPYGRLTLARSVDIWVLCNGVP